MNREDYEILVAMTPKNVRPPDYAVKLLEDVCTSTGLDWKKRHAYLMERGGKWMVTLSIDGFRLVGSQHPEYAGQEGPYWATAADSQWTDIPPDVKIYAAKVGIKHKTGVTTWGVIKYADYKAGPMWDKFPSTMSAKCAEMLAWRKAFPGVLGGLYGTEEMEQADRKRGRGLRSESGDGVDTPAPDGLPAKTPENVDAVKNSYHIRLTSAKSKDECRAIGKEITADKALSLAATMELHQLYTARMAACP